MAKITLIEALGQIAAKATLKEESFVELIKKQKNSEKLIPFLWAYANYFAAQIPNIEKEKERFEHDFNHKSSELFSAELFAEIRDFTKNKKIAQKANSRIIEIGDKIREIALIRKDKAFNSGLDMVLDIYEFSPEGLDKSFETIEMWINKRGIRQSHDSKVDDIIVKGGAKYAQRSTAILNLCFEQDNKNKEHRDNNAVEYATNIAFSHPEFYGNLEQLLTQELKEKIRYKNTNIVRGSEAEFKSSNKPSELLKIIPENWGYLAIFVQNKNGIKGTKNKIIDRIPASLGLQYKEDIETYDKNLTPKFIEQDGVFEDYILAASNADEAKIIKTTLLPKVLAKGYEISAIQAAEVGQNLGKYNREIDRFYDWRNEAGTNLDISFKERRTPKESEITLRTRYNTKDEDIQQITSNKELKLQKCQQQSR